MQQQKGRAHAQAAGLEPAQAANGVSSNRVIRRSLLRDAIMRYHALSAHIPTLCAQEPSPYDVGLIIGQSLSDVRNHPKEWSDYITPYERRR